MTLTTSIIRRAAISGLAITALASAAPAAQASTRIDPAVYDAGVPSGMIEHGTIAMTISGSRNAQRNVIEYWTSHDAWRSITREAATGSLVSEAFGNARSTHRYQPLNPASTRFIDMALPSPPPLAGFTSAYNKVLLRRGLLQAVGPITIAGFTGTDYVLSNEGPTDGAPAKTEIVLEDGTDAPLMRQTSIARPSGAPYVQREELTSRQTLAATPDQLAALSKPVGATRHPRKHHTT